MVDLVGGWVHGWARCRSTADPEPVPGGWRIAVGLPNHRVRYVLSGHDEQILAELGSRAAAPGTWIKVAGDPDRLRAALPPAWVMADTAYLMSAPFTPAERGAPPAPYRVRVVSDGPVAIAEIRDGDDALAAWGRLAPAGEVGVIDQVETDAAHRRRGLGSAIMHTLAAHAADLGLHTGVLAATEQGRGLYESLGWSVFGQLAAAHVPETLD
ncbi:GNAT family N-acetyltransferase [Actinoplanes sp. NPDC024001]|uniref:GNAT family N-acetyltransferase n=1 Tax=Actinoplanes sp. NPDC024001 TaxID=3154598 RepID=UPI0033D8DE49